MTTHRHITTHLAARAAMAAGVVAGVGGVIQLADAQSSESTTVGIEHLGLACFTALLLLLVPVVLHLGRLAGRPRLAAAAATGQVALALLTIVSNVRGEDPSFFPAIAVPANLLILAALAGSAITLRRRGALPRAAAIALGLVWVVTLVLSNVGGMVLAGGFWLAYGWVLEHGELPRAAAAPARASEA